MKLSNILIELIEEGVITDKKIIYHIYNEFDNELNEGAKDKFKKFVIGSLLAASLVGAGAAGVNKGQERAFKNIYPYDYNSQKYNPETGEMINIGFFERFKNAILNNKQEELRVGLDSSFFGNGYEQEKLDLWGMYLRRDRKHPTIVPTKYSPENKDGEFYKVPKLENDLKQDIANHLDNCTSFQEFKTRFLGLVEKGIIKGNVSTDTSGKAIVSIQPLGNATLSAGQDSKGYYISYEDTWDINPLKGGSKIDIDQLGIPGKIIKTLGLDKVEDISFGLNNPPNIYGKVYFEPK